MISRTLMWLRTTCMSLLYIHPPCPCQIWLRTICVSSPAVSICMNNSSVLLSCNGPRNTQMYLMCLMAALRLHPTQCQVLWPFISHLVQHSACPWSNRLLTGWGHKYVLPGCLLLLSNLSENLFAIFCILSDGELCPIKQCRVSSHNASYCQW